MTAAQPVAEGGGRRMLAGLDGRIESVSETHVVIEGNVAMLSGLAGLGGSAVGPVTFLPRGESPAVATLVPGSVLVYPHRVPPALLQRAVMGNVAAIIAASAGAVELESFARVALPAVLAGATSPATDLVVVLTDGFGDTTMNPQLLRALAACDGQTVLVNGTTQLAHNVRPETLLPPLRHAGAAPGGDLTPGARVRVIAGAQRGAEGTVVRIHAQPQPCESGLTLPAATVRLDSGQARTVPIAVLQVQG